MASVCLTRAETNTYNFGIAKITVSKRTFRIDRPQYTYACIGHSETNYGGQARAVAVSDNFAYLVNSADGMRIFDVSNPTTPRCVGHPTNREYAQGIAVSDKRVYLASDRGLRIYDVSDPTNPVGGKTFGAAANGVAVSGNYAYLAQRDEGLAICDVSDAAHPVIVAQTNNGGAGYGVALSGNHAYLANANDGLRVYDVSDPAHPVNTAHVEGYVLGVAVSSNLVYLAGGGLQIFDASNPTNLVQLAQTNNSGMTISVALLGNRAFVANQMGCVRVYDVTDPSHPFYLADTTTNDGPSSMVGVAVSGDTIYHANGKDGLRIHSR